jgi:hypothetical protein
MTKQKKYLPWAKLTGPQAKYRIINEAIDVIICVAILGGITFGFIIPALYDFGIYADAVDINKLADTPNSDSVIGSMTLITIMGLLSPLFLGFWVYGKLVNFSELLFKRLGFDIGYAERSEDATKGSITST